MSEKWARLKEVVTGMESVLVAYSGGADSALVAKVAFDLLGDRAVAVTARSPSFPSYEWEQSCRVAREIGIRHLSVETHELENPAYRANQGDRCYFCKSELYAILHPKAEELGLTTIVNGTHRDDLADIRPGLKAAAEQRIRSPLVEVGLGKEEIRELSRQLGLSTWNKPSLACLASRLPIGTEVSRERLQRIDRVESGLAGLGFKTFRVRCHEPIARIEVGPEEFSLLLDPEIRQRITKLCHENGFSYAALDLEGYRYGNLSQIHL